MCMTPGKSNCHIVLHTDPLGWWLAHLAMQASAFDHLRLNNQISCTSHQHPRWK